MANPAGRTEPPAAPSGGPSAEYPYPAKTVDVLGSRMHLIDEGAGSPILFVHGNPSWSYVWRNVIPRLSGLGRCIAPDLIGMGRSDKPEIDYGFFDHSRYLEGLIAALGLENVVLVLHDWGSALGFHYAMRHAENVRGIAFLEALLAPYPTWEEFPARSAPPQLRETFRAFRTGGEGGPGWRALVEQNVFIEQLLPGVAGRPLTAREMDFYREPFREPASRKVIWRWANQLPIGGEPADVARAVAAYSAWLQATPIPKLLLHTDPGAVLGAELVAWSQAHLPALVTVDLGPGAHFPQESDPVGLARALAAWIQELPAR